MGCVEYGEAYYCHGNEENTQYYTEYSLAFLVDYSRTQAGKEETSQKAAQMTPVINIVTARGEEEDEDDDHDGGAVDLALEDRTNQIKARPVDDNIADNDSYDSIKRGGGPYFDSLWLQ